MAVYRQGVVAWCTPFWGCLYTACDRVCVPDHAYVSMCMYRGPMPMVRPGAFFHAGSAEGSQLYATSAPLWFTLPLRLFLVLLWMSLVPLLLWQLDSCTELDCAVFWCMACMLASVVVCLCCTVSATCTALFLHDRH